MNSDAHHGVRQRRSAKGDAMRRRGVAPVQRQRAQLPLSIQPARQICASMKARHSLRVKACDTADLYGLPQPLPGGSSAEDLALYALGLRPAHHIQFRHLDWRGFEVCLITVEPPRRRSTDAT